MDKVTLDWSSIRPLNGGRDRGFEELCSQLARSETPHGCQFVRKGTPDAGVECYAILQDDSEWAWQSKYFDGLGNSQWQQIDKSVKAVIEKHPRLVQYFVSLLSKLTGIGTLGSRFSGLWDGPGSRQS
jgi:hypothetical protein